MEKINSPELIPMDELFSRLDGGTEFQQPTQDLDPNVKAIAPNIMPLAELQQKTELQDPFLVPKAFGAGALRSATFGLSDVGLTATGLVEPETLRALKRKAPGATLAGELAPFVAAPFTGPSSLAGKATSLIRKSGEVSQALAGAATAKLANTGSSFLAKNAVQKATQAGLGSAIEGGFISAGQYVSDAALGDASLNAESLVARVGLGAALGGAFGLTFNAAGQGIKKFSETYKPAVKKLFQKVSRIDDETIDFISNDKNWANLKSIQQDMQKSPQETIENRLTTVWQQFDEKAAEFRKTYGNNLTQLLKQYQLDGQSVPLRSLRSVVRRQINNLKGQGIVTRSALRQIKQLEDFEETLTSVALTNIEKSNLGRLLKQSLKDFKGNAKQKREFLFRIANRAEARPELRLTAAQINEISKRANAEAASLNLYNPVLTTKVGAHQWSKIGQAARKELNKFKGTGGANIKQLNKQYGEFLDATSQLKKFGFAKHDDIAQALPDLRSLFLGSGKRIDAARPALKKLDRVLGTNFSYEQQLLRAFDRLNQSSFGPLLTGYSVLLPAMSALTGISMGLPGPAWGAIALGTFATQSPALRRPIISAAKRVAPGIDASLDFMTKQGQRVPPGIVPFISAKIAGFGQIETDVQEVRQKTSGAMGEFLQNPTGFKLKPMQKAAQTQELTLERILELSANQQAFDAYMDEQLSDLRLIYPSVEEPIKQKMAEGLAYLAGEAPKQLEVSSFLEASPEPSDQQISEFQLKKGVLDRPESVLEKLKNETLTSIEAEAFRRFYPNIYNEMRQTFIENAAEAKQNLSFNQKLQLSLFFDVEGISALRGPELQALQATFAQPMEVQAPSPIMSRGLVKVASSLETQGQRGYGAN